MLYFILKIYLTLSTSLAIASMEDCGFGRIGRLLTNAISVTKAYPVKLNPEYAQHLDHGSERLGSNYTNIQSVLGSDSRRRGALHQLNQSSYRNTFLRAAKNIDNANKMKKWAFELKKEILGEMQMASVAFSPENFQDFFHLVTYRRAKTIGFKVADANSKKIKIGNFEYRVEAGHVLIESSNDLQFKNVIDHGYLFIDMLFDNNLADFHGPYSHLLQQLYLAETNIQGLTTTITNRFQSFVPYPDLYKRMGTNRIPTPTNRNPIWDVFGDGPERTNGNPSSITWTFCKFFYFKICPDKIN